MNLQHRRTNADRRIRRSNFDWSRFTSHATAVLVARATKACDGCQNDLGLGDVAYRIKNVEGEQKYLCQKCAKAFTEQRSAFRFEEQGKVRAQMQKDFEKEQARRQAY